MCAVTNKGSVCSCRTRWLEKSEGVHMCSRESNSCLEECSVRGQHLNMCLSKHNSEIWIAQSIGAQRSSAHALLHRMNMIRTAGGSGAMHVGVLWSGQDFDRDKRIKEVCTGID
jgi:hypothetical protein